MILYYKAADLEDTEVTVGRQEISMRQKYFEN